MPDFQLLLRFVLVGGSTALLYMGVPYWLVEGAGLHTTVASTIGLTVAICYNYPMHYHWTFSSEAPHGKAVVRYLLMCAGALLVNGLVMHLGTAASSLHYMFVQILAAVIVTTWSLSLSSLWVFRGS
jgi:putative flippase GtrA